MLSGSLPYTVSYWWNPVRMSTHGIPNGALLGDAATSAVLAVEGNNNCVTQCFSLVLVKNVYGPMMLCNSTVCIPCYGNTSLLYVYMYTYLDSSQTWKPVCMYAHYIQMYSTINYVQCMLQLSMYLVYLIVQVQFISVLSLYQVPPPIHSTDQPTPPPLPMKKSRQSSVSSASLLSSSVPTQSPMSQFAGAEAPPPPLPPGSAPRPPMRMESIPALRPIISAAHTSTPPAPPKPPRNDRVPSTVDPVSNVCSHVHVHVYSTCTCNYMYADTVHVNNTHSCVLH